MRHPFLIAPQAKEKRTLIGCSPRNDVAFFSFAVALPSLSTIWVILEPRVRKRGLYRAIAGERKTAILVSNSFFRRKGRNERNKKEGKDFSFRLILAKASPPEPLLGLAT